MSTNFFREAGLPQPLPDMRGGQERYNTEVGFVVAVHPDVWCVDVQPHAGGLLRNVQVADYALPHVHEDGKNPSLVEFWHRGGEIQDVWCRRVHWRRFMGPETAGEEEKRYYHKHLKIERIGDITVRITPDNRIYLFDAESGDYCLYEQEKRTFHVIAPHIFYGTDEQNRQELHTEGLPTDQMRLVIPQYFMGKEGLPDTDGLTYIQDSLIHLMSTLIKLTADEIVLDPTSIKLGHRNATERVMLGDAWMNFYNAFVTLFNSHVHTNVQTGGGLSGPPQTGTSAMTSAILSDVTRVSKTGT